MNKIKLVISVAAEYAAALLAVLNDQNIPAEIQVAGTDNGNDAAHEAKIDAQVRQANRTRRATAAVERQTAKVAATATKRQTVTGNRPGRIVLYTPAGTRAQINKVLAGMDKSSMNAHVYADLVKHPGSVNADVRKRLANTFKKNGRSVESVDNIIWLLTKKGLVSKSAGA